MRVHLGVLTIALLSCSSVSFGQAVAGVGAASARAGDSSTANVTTQDAAPAGLAPGDTAARLQTIPASAPPQVSRQPAEAPLLAANPANATWALQTHGVVTDDDLAAMRTGVAINYLWSRTRVLPSIDPSSCDAGCEAEARAAAGMGAIPNGEWQGQFEAARVDLADDNEWREAYLDGLQKAHKYCVFRGQPKDLAAGNAGQSSNEREQYVGDTNQELGRELDGAAARLQQEIQRAQRIDSVRAAMMEVLAERAFNQCPSEPRQ